MSSASTPEPNDDTPASPDDGEEGGEAAAEGTPSPVAERAREALRAMLGIPDDASSTEH